MITAETLQKLILEHKEAHEHYVKLCAACVAQELIQKAHNRWLEAFEALCQAQRQVRDECIV
jgi:hypothetical protein